MTLKCSGCITGRCSGKKPPNQTEVAKQAKPLGLHPYLSIRSKKSK